MAPLRPNLPSLHGLRVFEAVARQMSFTNAARELSVTQTAVSHQIKSLEAELGVALFRRSPRRIALTEHGKSWALELGEVFARLHAINRKLRGEVSAKGRVLAISIIPSFASRWLVPRLGRFMAQHPDFEVRISASAELVDFTSEAIDLGIRYGFGRYPGLATEKLADDSWVVVCAPELAARLRSPQDLKKHLLLNDDEPGAWASWLAAVGHALPGVRHNVLNDSSLVVEAAVRGQGVALARGSLAADELSLGRLVLPFPEIAPLPTGLAYYLAAPRENFRRPEVAAFRDWIRVEARTLRFGRPHEPSPKKPHRGTLPRPKTRAKPK
ncbi:MAG TPA: transcriptional regulator GcvA [Polyangiaceae bacterium]|nr:transcriptional regulator GcvA [Polyangiaceae bacterium]